jgi:hypothetical protein
MGVKDQCVDLLSIRMARGAPERRNRAGEAGDPFAGRKMFNKRYFFVGEPVVIMP